jgi:prepilin-type processing-associated H-X9-DG protein
VVIAIIAILAAILFPVFAQARDKARQATCQSNLKQIGNAMLMYAQDYDENMVYNYAYQAGGAGLWWWEDFIQPYAKNYQIFVCPSADPKISYRARRDQAWFRAQWPDPLVTTYTANTAAFQSAAVCSQLKPTGTCTPPMRSVGATVDPNNMPQPYAMAAIEDPAGTILITESWTKEIWQVESTSAWRPRPGQIGPYDSKRNGSWEGRHNEANNILWGDGHVKPVKWSGQNLRFWTREAD